MDVGFFKVPDGAVCMSMVLTMDRPIDKEKHYISPGSYQMLFETGQSVQFDFLDSCRQVDSDDPTKVAFEVYNLDKEAFPESVDLPKLLLNSKVIGIEDFFVYCGEDDEPEINVVGVSDVSFTIGDSPVITISDEVFKSYKF